jgi:voltage-gated potassium channel
MGFTLTGCKQGWSIGGGIYASFIKALTVGCGERRPITGHGKVPAVFTALLGLVTTGIIVAPAVEAATLSYARHDAGAA